MGIAGAPPQDVSDAALIASALRWWHDAGIGPLIAEEPRDWLGRAMAAKAATGRPATKIEAAPELPRLHHADLPALVAWLMTSTDVPEGGSPRRRVGPTGDPAAPLMVLTDFPDHDDIAEGQLFAGESGRLFDAMLAAIGRDRTHVYLASLLPSRPAIGRIDESVLAAVTPHARRHVELAGARQLWLFGTAASRAILGMTEPEANGKLHAINLNGRKIDAIATAPPRLLTNVDQKRRAWTEMKRLNAGDPE